MKSLYNFFSEIDSVVNKYRPLLQTLDLQHLSEDLNCITLQKFRTLFLPRCLIVTQRQNISGDCDGYFTFINDKKHDLFILSIVINDKLFLDDSLENRIKRKTVGVHEFVHCVAVMICVFQGWQETPILC